MPYTNRLYVILHPTVALIGSQLAPEALARHYTVGPTRHYRGKVIFAEVDVDFRDPYFGIEAAIRELKPHEDGRPKATKFISSYRVLEFIPWSACRELYLTTPEGYCIELEAQPLPTTAPDGGLSIYAEIAPLRMLVLSRYGFLEFGRHITDPANPVGAPRFFYTQLGLDVAEFAAEFEHNPFMEPPIRNLHPSILRDAIAELASTPTKPNKGLALTSSLDDVSYRLIARGFILASPAEHRFYPMPPAAEIERRNLKFWRSM